MAKKILVVDDDPNIVKLIKLRLEANNYQITTAHDGEECVAKVLSERPDLILLDIMMPRSDGYSALIGLKEMKAVSEDLPDIPVIILTAVADPRIRDLVKKEQIKDFIVKPFSAEDLLAKVKKAIG